METDEALLGETSFKTVSEAIIDGVLEKDMNSFTCQLCKISMTGLVPAKCHLQGNKHKKAVNTSKMEACGKDQGAANPDTIDNSVSTAIMKGQVIHKTEGVQKFLICSPCNKQCTGELPMRQHLHSEQHAKKVRMDAFNSSLSSLKEKSPIRTTTPTFSIHTTSTSLKEKSPIHTTTTSQVDSASPANTSPVRGSEVVQAMKDGIIRTTGEANHIECLVCETFCTGEINMRQHLMGKNHLKAQMVKLSLRRYARSISPPTVTLQHTSPQPKDDMTQKDRLASSLSPERDVLQKGRVQDSPPRKAACDVAAQIRSCLEEQNHTSRSRKDTVASSISSRKNSISSTTSQSDSVPSGNVSPMKGNEVAHAMKEGVIRVMGEANHLECLVCGTSCTGEINMKQHLEGRRHLKAAQMFDYVLRVSGTLGMSLAGTKRKALNESVHQIPFKMEKKDEDIAPLQHPGTPAFLPLIYEPEKMNNDKVGGNLHCNSPSRVLDNELNENDSSSRVSDQDINENLTKKTENIRVYLAKDKLTDLFL